MSRLATIASAATFAHPIADVIEIGSDEEVIGPHAGRIVAAVKDLQTIGDRGNVEFKGYPMSAFESLTPDADVPVTLGGFGPQPEPTAISDLNFFPESLTEGSGCRHGGSLEKVMVAPPY